jgi:hypothetical protein
MNAPVLTRSALRAFLYTFDLAPIRRALAEAGPEAAEATLAQLAPHEIARVLAALPAGQQIAVFRALDAGAKDRLPDAGEGWGRVVPILAAYQASEACKAPLTALGR